MRIISPEKLRAIMDGLQIYHREVVVESRLLDESGKGITRQTVSKARSETQSCGMNVEKLRLIYRSIVSIHKRRCRQTEDLLIELECEG